MPGYQKILFLLTVVLLIFGVFYVFSGGDYERLFWQEKVEFSSDIKPIINNSCIVCHGGVKQMGEFSLLFPEEAYSRNESGKYAIVPGSPEESEMIRLIRHHDPDVRMPLEAEPLSEKEIELLTKWIAQGAEWGDHWAYINPEPADPPDINSDWIENEVDHFILQKLQQRDIQPSPGADKASLLRRVSLDLTGLPPTLDELRDFLDDDSPDAYEKVVDRLLASPRYGERWASMWMDLARYADSKGYEADGYRNIWQYRDWLIKAFNEDKPFDEFTIEQLAGDLLPDPTDEQIIATAFHRNTMNNDEGGTDNEEFRVAAVIDRVNTTWETWQATTMECAQCHNHTYDPIRMEDFYRSYAYFNNTADADVPSESPNLKIFESEMDRQRLEEIRDWIHGQTTSMYDPAEKVREFVDLIRFTEPKIHPHLFDEVEKGTNNGRYLSVEPGGHARITDVDLYGKDRMFIRYRANRGTGEVEIRKDHPGGEKIGHWDIRKNRWEENSEYEEGRSTDEIVSIPIKPQQERHDLYFVFHDPHHDGFIVSVEWVLFHEDLPGSDQPGYEQVREEFKHLLNTSDDVIETPVMVELEGNYKRATRVFDRGNWMVHGEEVTPGVPDAWNDMPEEAPDNRLGLARWLVSKENPLTARVTVNRLWAELFGTGIVETISDFGSQGFEPSHPELLDWLAMQFMHEHGWSIKKQLKQIVMSAAYRQNSKLSPELREIDPDNRLLARGPRIRLSAEQIRDQALLVSGLLSDKMYGPSVMPPQPEGVWQQVYSGMKWETSEGEDRYRRALYTFWRRTNPYPSLVTFDAPGREVCVSRRINTNTPLQALVTLNDPVYIEAAQNLAGRMIKAAPLNVEEQLKAGYRYALFRDIDPEKLEVMKELYLDAKDHFEENSDAAREFTGEDDLQLAALTVVANAIMNLDEFLTKS